MKKITLTMRDVTGPDTITNMDANPSIDGHHVAAMSYCSVHNHAIIIAVKDQSPLTPVDTRCVIDSLRDMLSVLTTGMSVDGSRVVDASDDDRYNDA